MIPETRIPFKIVGVDLTEEMVEHARENYAEENVSFSCLDIGKEINLPSEVTRKFSKVKIHNLNQNSVCISDIFFWSDLLLLLPSLDQRSKCSSKEYSSSFGSRR